MNPTILVVVAVEAERAAVLQGLSEQAPIKVITCGVGPAAAAAATAMELAGGGSYQLVISAGIGGGFHPQAAIGSLVVSSLIAAADLGAESADGFITIEQLGFGQCSIPASAYWSEAIYRKLQAAALPSCIAPIITAATATGTSATAAARLQQTPGAAAEGMEGHGVATAAQLRNLPIVELRAISNAVGPRDRDAWRIKDALAALEAAFRAIEPLCITEQTP
ncbi:futalosine hydrolase [Paenibacillus sp. IITD108]|uniref:futalosine hydrolase n=1 Tax=Paenibacillus sp. IITD108 TaxID=3116649 RepID=UPI002F40FDF2